MGARDLILRALIAPKQRGVHYAPDSAVDLLNEYRAAVLREAADMVAPAGDTCRCGDCAASQGHAAALRHEADLTDGTAT